MKSNALLFFSSGTFLSYLTVIHTPGAGKAVCLTELVLAVALRLSTWLKDFKPCYRRPFAVSGMGFFDYSFTIGAPSTLRALRRPSETWSLLWQSRKM